MKQSIPTKSLEVNPSESSEVSPSRHSSEEVAPHQPKSAVAALSRSEVTPSTAGEETSTSHKSEKETTESSRSEKETTKSSRSEEEATASRSEEEASLCMPGKEMYKSRQSSEGETSKSSDRSDDEDEKSSDTSQDEDKKSSDGSEDESKKSSDGSEDESSSSSSTASTPKGRTRGKLRRLLRRDSGRSKDFCRNTMVPNILFTVGLIILAAVVAMAVTSGVQERDKTIELLMKVEEMYPKPAWWKFFLNPLWINLIPSLSPPSYQSPLAVCGPPPETISPLSDAHAEYRGCLSKYILQERVRQKGFVWLFMLKLLTIYAVWSAIDLVFDLVTDYQRITNHIHLPRSMLSP